MRCGSRGLKARGIFPKEVALLTIDKIGKTGSRATVGCSLARFDCRFLQKKDSGSRKAVGHVRFDVSERIIVRTFVFD